MKRKNIKLIRLSGMILLLTISSFSSIYAQTAGETFTRNNVKYKILTSNTVSVNGTAGTISNPLSIPQTVTDGGYTFTVTQIDANAFSSSTNCSSIKALTLPESVTTIGDNAFKACPLSDSLIIKGSITSIGNNAFKSGITITKLDIYDQNAYWAATFGSTLSNPICFCLRFYSRGKVVKTLKINMENVPDDAFKLCTQQFYTLIIGQSVKTIGTNCFNSSCRPKKTLWLPNVIPSGLTSSSCAIGTINYCEATAYMESDIFSSKDISHYNLNNRQNKDGIIYAKNNETNRWDVIDCDYEANNVSVNIGPSVTVQGSQGSATCDVGDIRDYACYNDESITGSIVLSNPGYVGKYAFYKCNNAKGSIQLTNSGEIKEYAFSECSGIKGSITASTNVNNICDYAFQKCSNATSASITNSGYIGKYAFKICSSLQTLEISNSGYIGEYAFASCTGLQTLTVSNIGNVNANAFSTCSISQSATITNQGSINEYAFSNIQGNFSAEVNNRGSMASQAFAYSKMKSLTIGNSVTSIGDNCFSGCTINEQATINNSGEIGTKAFYNIQGNFNANIQSSGTLPISCFENSKMNQVTIGNSILTLDNSCFKSTTFISISIGTGLHTIKAEAFSGATGFTQITLPSNVNTIGDYCFQNCTTMRNITLSRGVSNLPKGTFSGCSALVEMFVPKEINTIGDYSFDNCTNLKTFTFEDKNGNYTYQLGKSGGNGLFKTCGLDSVYVGGRLSFEKSPFLANTSLRSVKFTGNETKVYDNEFQNCTNLQNVYMGENMNPIGNYAFSGCTSLVRFTVGPAVTELGQYSFSGCSALKHIDLSNVVTIKNNSFQNCSSLEEIRIPQSTTVIQNKAFRNCTSLSNFYFEDRTSNLSLGYNESGNNYNNIEGAGEPIFSDCPLDSVYIGGPITYSKEKANGYSPFYFNKSLRSVYITNKEKTVQENEFYNCTGLESIKLGEGVTKIDNFGFHNCESLLYFEFASTLQTIGKQAFSDCNSLTCIISHATNPPTCGEGALEDIPFLDCALYVPEGATAAYREAEQWCNFFPHEFVIARAISLDMTTIEFSDRGQNQLLVATLTPDNVLDKSVTWTSSDPAVATVSNEGLVTAVDIGTATITATTNDGSNLSATCAVTVVASPVITFADAAVKALCVDNWDTNGDGNLSEAEAAAVTNLGTVFKSNKTITSFNELQFFTGLTEIENFAFMGCTNLTSVIIPENVTTIGIQSFQSAIHLSSVTIPEGVTTIALFAFQDCVSLTSIHIPSSVTVIDGAFNIQTGDCSSSGFPSVRESITVAEGNTKYDSRENCNAIIETATNRLLYGCSNTFIPSGVTAIGNNAFCNSTITSIVIPNSVDTISNGAFAYCNSLTSVTVYIETPLIISSTTFTNRANATLYVPAGCKAAYEAADYWKEFKEIIEMDPVITDLSELSNNKLYTFTSKRGRIIRKSDGSGLQGESARDDETEADTRFAILKIDGAYYLYSSVDKKFFLSGIEDGGEFKRYTASPISFDDTHPDGDYLWVVNTTDPNGNTMCFNYNGTYKIEINTWGVTTGMFDDGNRWIITAVSDFDPTEALEQFETDISISLNQELLSLSIGESASLTASILPSDADLTVQWSSSNSEVASVNNGVVTAIAAGNATITATTNEVTNLTATCEVTVTNGSVDTGDANGDGAVNVTDYLAVANYILGTNTANFNETAADVNTDGAVNVSDYVGVANIVLYGNYQGQSVNAIMALNAENTSAWLEMEPMENGKVSILLHNAKSFSAFQMDIQLPDGVEIVEANMAKASQSKHLGYAKLDNGTWRLLYGTLENKAVMLSDDNLLTLELEGNTANIGGNMTIDQIFLVDRNTATWQLSAVHGGLPTGITVLENASAIDGDCYDLTGRKVGNSLLKKGVYFVKGKKMLVK